MQVDTILTWFDDTPEGAEQLQAAMEAALWFDAHLSVAAVAYLPELGYGPDRAAERRALRLQALDTALERAGAVFARFTAQGIEGVAFPFVTLRAEFRQQFDCLARFVDVTVATGPRAPLSAGPPRDDPRNRVA